MRNVEMKVEQNTLIIKVDLEKRLGPSKSGKNIIVGSTDGIAKLSEDQRFHVGLNVFTDKDR
jgi:hypothetical protein